MNDEYEVARDLASHLGVDFLGQLMQALCGTILETRQDLERAIAAQDAELARQTAHRAKSGFGALGAVTALGMAREIEERATRGVIPSESEVSALVREAEAFVAGWCPVEKV